MQPTAPVGLQDVMPTLLDAAGVQVPESCTGRSLLPVLRGETGGVREVLHGEHSGCYAYEEGNHFLVDGNHKYIWYSQTGREHLFSTSTPIPGSCTTSLWMQTRRRDLLRGGSGWWRCCGGRPEGCVEGDRLVAGRRHGTLLPGYDPDKSWPFL